jgi:hypothetical protein
MAEKADDMGAVTLAELAAVKGQLTLIAQMIQHNHDATHQRIDDLRHSIEGRISGIDGRVSTLESRERETALRTAGLSAVSGSIGGALVSGLLAAMRGQ